MCIESQHVHVLPSVAYVGTGWKMTLTCHHPSHPNTTVRWSRGGPTSLRDAILEGDDVTLLSSGSNLFISQFNTSRHAGYYTCIVEGVAGRLVSCLSEVKHARKHVSAIFFLCLPSSKCIQSIVQHILCFD